MKKYYWTKHWTKRCVQALKDFQQNQSGVYAVLTALLSFPLLVLIAFTVDGTGIILDKVRLTQATDQAALLLVAENNSYRKNTGHADVVNQQVTQDELKKFNGDKLSAQQDKRNQELIQGLAKMYLRSDDKNQQDKSKPVTIDTPFYYDCKEFDLRNPQNQYSRRRPVVCEVQGNVNREFWIPLSAELVKTQVTQNGRLPINSGMSYAVKEKGIVIPVELMLVSDFSGSMDWVIGNDWVYEPINKKKIVILRKVVKDIQGILFPSKDSKQSTEVSPYNRMGFATFAAGARQRGDTSECIMPYYVKDQEMEFRINRADVKTLSLTREPNDADCEQKTARYSNGESFNFEVCKVKGVPKTVFQQVLDHALFLSSNLMFNDILDVKKTVDQVDNFTGQRINDYNFKVSNGGLCLGGNDNVQTTQAWFDRNNPNISEALDKVKPEGGTAASAGLLIGANLLMEKNTDAEAQPERLGTNTQRILMVLSDGEDNQPSGDTLVTLLNAGLCQKIRDKADTLQNKNYEKLPTKIAFAAFGFKPPADQKKAWQDCVGENNYYEPNSEEALLDAFKQILSFEEEVGRSSIKKPTF
ncbi:pilus assembly protein TadG-related protein [Pasteurella sp. PK-2025]|uniref:TadE/TadG family type IV pilus assembly protein n=1 Tax=Pasteurella sp. PK-2025 TaxID=3413133 RepID=UPI003C72198C